MDNIIKLFKPTEGSGNELKPCPFCGSSEVAFAQYEHHTGALRWKVMCCACVAQIDPGYAQHPHNVAALWNRRMEAKG